MTLAEPELFAEGSCGRPLPAGELLQEFRFGQFSPLKRLKAGSEVTVVVGEDIQYSVDAGNWGSLRRFTAAAPSGRGGVMTFAELLQEESDALAAAAPTSTRASATAAATVTLPPEQVAEAIAS